MQICGSCKPATNLGQQIAKSANCKKYFVCKSQIRKLPHTRKVSKCNKFCKSTNLRISRGLGEDDSWKKPKTKNLVTLSHKSKMSAHTRMHWCHFTKLYILSLETIPLKSRVNGFLKRNIQEFIFQYRVFTKSIISHPFLNHFHRNNSIYKISTPSYRGKEEICRRMPCNFFSSAQFQRKRKSLVFFQSINFLCIWASSSKNRKK